MRIAGQIIAIIHELFSVFIQDQTT